MKKKSTVKVVDVTSDQVKQVLEMFANGKIGVLQYRGVLNYDRLLSPAVKNATAGDVYYVIAKKHHREDDENWYHWEAEYIFNGKDWVCCGKHERPENKETAKRLEKIEKSKREADMARREAESCHHMKMLAM